jgi:O-antigen/teichoic acid export membrane protein
MAVSNVLAKVLNTIFFIILARTLSVADYGNLRYLLSLALLFAIGFSGFPVSVTRHISVSKASKTRVDAIASTSLAISLAILSIEIVLAAIFFSDKLVLIVLLIGIFADNFYYGIIRGFLDYPKLYFYRLIGNFFEIVFVIGIVLFWHNTVFVAALIYSGTFLVAMWIMEIQSKTAVTLRTRYANLATLKSILYYAIPVTLGSIAYEFMLNVDSVLIKQFVDVTSVAYYGTAKTLTQIFAFLPMAVSTVILPKLSSVDKKTDIRHYIVTMTLGLFAFSLFLFVLLLFVGKWLIVTLFTERYLPSFDILYIVALAQIFLAIYGVYSTIWVSLKKLYVGLSIMLIVAAVDIVANFTFIPKYGIMGASYVLLGTSVLALASTASYLFWYLNQRGEQNSAN